MLKVAPNPNNNSRNKFQEDNLKLSNDISSGKFSDRKWHEFLMNSREVALLFLLVRKARNNRTSNSRRAKKRTEELKRLESLLNDKLNKNIEEKM